MRMTLAAPAMAVAIMLATAPARATTITVNEVLDPANLGPYNFIDHFLATPFTAGLGDTVVFNLSFTGGGTVTLADATYFGLYSWAQSGDAVLTMDTSWTFLNPSANLNASSTNTDTASGVALFSYTSDSQYRLAPGPISFSGITVTASITGLSDVDTDNDGVPDTPSANPRTYESIGLRSDGTIAAAVPEPAGWAMMIGGLGLVGGAVRRRRPHVAIRFG